jgi:hypothetical protein
MSDSCRLLRSVLGLSTVQEPLSLPLFSAHSSDPVADLPAVCKATLDRDTPSFFLPWRLTVDVVQILGLGLHWGIPLTPCHFSLGNQKAASSYIPIVNGGWQRKQSHVSCRNQRLTFLRHLEMTTGKNMTGLSPASPCASTMYHVVQTPE